VRSRSLLASFNYAIEGVVHALRAQRNVRIHLVIAVIVLIASLFFRISRFEFIAIVFAIGLVLASELGNTAVEATVDLATDGYNPLAKIAKDVAAAAVLISAITAVVIGYLVFIGHVSGVMDSVLARVRHTPAHLTVLAVLVTSIVVLAVKAATKTGTYLRGGWPSGHAAVGAAAAAAIAYVTANPGVTALAALLVVLIAQSRVENGAHSVLQVVAGALLGLLVTTLVFQLFWF